MPEHLHHDDEAIVNADTQHEETDVNVRALMIFLIVFIVFSVFTHFLIYYLFKGFVHMERRSSAASPAVTSMVKPADAGIPATPRLQPFPSKSREGDVVAPYRNTPVIDMAEMLRTQNEHLATYGWVEPAKGSVRIPVERAKQLALQRGFVVIAAPGASAAAPSVQTVPVQTVPPVTGQSPAMAPAPAVVPVTAAPHQATEGSHP